MEDPIRTRDGVRPTPHAAPSRVRRFAGPWLAGVVGVAALLLQPPPPSLLEQSPGLAALPDLALRAVLLINPLVLVTVAAAAGAFFAHRVGLRSALAGDRGSHPAPGTALVVGATLALVLAGVDGILEDRLGAQWREVTRRAAVAPAWPALPIGVLYGGLAEEVVLRWGLMSAAAWAVTRATGRGSATPGGLAPWAAWLSIGIAAVAFAAGHLPALAATVEPTGPIVARTLGLNLLAGVAYGWLFWRRGLETAMLAHAATHVGLAAARWAG